MLADVAHNRLWPLPGPEAAPVGLGGAERAGLLETNAVKMQVWPQKNTMESGTVDFSEKQQIYVKKTHRNPRIGAAGSRTGCRGLPGTGAGCWRAGCGGEPHGTRTAQRRARSTG